MIRGGGCSCFLSAQIVTKLAVLSQLDWIQNNNAKPFLTMFSGHITDMTQSFCPIKHPYFNAKNHIQKFTDQLWECGTSATMCQWDCQERPLLLNCICFTRKCSVSSLYFHSAHNYSLSELPLGTGRSVFLEKKAGSVLWGVLFFLCFE